MAVKLVKRLDKYSNEEIADVFIKKGCDLGATAKYLRVSRASLKKLAESSKDLMEMLTDANESMIDQIECKAFKKALKGDINAMKFVLDRKARHRGWGEKVEVSTKVDIAVNILEARKRANNLIEAESDT